MTNDELIQKAQAVIKPRKIAHGCTVGDVGCALLTEEGNLHLGVCIDAGGGIGFPTEPEEIAWLINMLKKGAPLLTSDEARVVENALRRGAN